jgi:hypothetical protein
MELDGKTVEIVGLIEIEAVLQFCSIVDDLLAILDDQYQL